MYGKWSSFGAWEAHTYSAAHGGVSQGLSLKLESSEPLYTEGAPFTIQSFGGTFISESMAKGAILFWLIRANHQSPTHELMYFADALFGKDVYQTALRMELNKVHLSAAPSLIIKGYSSATISSGDTVRLLKSAIYEKILTVYPHQQLHQVVIDADASSSESEFVQAVRFEFGEKEGVSVKLLKPIAPKTGAQRGIEHEC